MPCWYYDKQELRETASARDGIDFDTETRYRREGARFIIDAGTKMCLRHDTCASGVVYFHRFYMFHSFREFHRHVVAACCLFLAGKVEETPKKCKDLIRTCRSQLTEQQFQVFGEDPKEEVMTLERILLQTIKFDLQLEHPYAYLLKYAKRLQGPDLSKADKNKIQKMVQMAWTFINDSLCTRLPLQWEPDIIAVALMYLASRLSKFEITDWQGKPPGFRGKWYEYLVEDVTLDLLEDICHQVLDLYSPSNAGRDESPPPPPPPPRAVQGQQAAVRRSRPATPSDASRPDPAAKRSRQDPTRSRSKSTSPGPQRDDAKRPDKAKLPVGAPGKPIPNMAQFSNAAVQPGSKHSSPAAMALPGAAGLPPPASGGAATASGQFTNYNPYVSQNKYSASFLTHEGLASIQNLLGNNSGRGQGSRGYPTSQPPRPRGHTPATRPGNAPRGPYPPSTQPPPPQQSGYQQSYRQPPQPPAPGNHSNPQGFQQPPPQPPPSTNSNPPGYQQPPPQPPPGNPPQYQQPPPPPQPGFQQQPQQQQQPARYPPPSGYNPQAQYNQPSYNQSGPSGGFHGPQGGQNHQQQQQQQQSYPQNYQPQNQQAHPNYNPQQQQQQQPQNQYNMNQYGNTQMYPQQQQQQQQQGQYHGYNNQVPPDGNYQNYPPTGGFNRPPGPPGQNMYPGPGGPPSVRITPRR